MIIQIKKNLIALKKHIFYEYQPLYTHWHNAVQEGCIKVIRDR